MRILVTNDDGVGAPGIAALAAAATGSGHQVVVVAPMTDYSGAGAAVGPIHSREGVDYHRHTFGGLGGLAGLEGLAGLGALAGLEGLADVPAFGIDGPPALATILACVGAFGPPPDVVLSGINHGANVGRSTMHSGTVGAALTAAHYGLRALAVSIRFGTAPVPWETPCALAGAALDELAACPPGTVLNLNVPDVHLAQLAGVRSARLAAVGTIRSAVHHGDPRGAAERPDVPGPTGAGSTADAGLGAEELHVPLPKGPSGTFHLDLSARHAHQPADTDVALLARQFATLTALTGVREAPAGSAMEGTLAALTKEAGRHQGGLRP